MLARLPGRLFLRHVARNHSAGGGVTVQNTSTANRTHGVPAARTAVATVSSPEPSGSALTTSCFDVVRPALQQLYADLCRRYESTVTYTIWRALYDLWLMFRGTEFNYATDLARFAYLYGYMPGKASTQSS